MFHPQGGTSPGRVAGLEGPMQVHATVRVLIQSSSADNLVLQTIKFKLTDAHVTFDARSKMWCTS